MTSTAPWFELPPESDSDAPVVVVGAGLAGCHTAYELATRNIRVKLIDSADCIAAGASGNSTGIVKPFVTRNPGTSNQFYAAAFDYLINRLQNNPDLSARISFNACGVLQLLERGYPTNSAYRVCNPAQASDVAGVPIDSDAIFFANGGYLNPQALCQAMVEHQNIDVQYNTSVKKITRTDSHWVLHLDSQLKKQTNQRSAAPVYQSLNCQRVILANGQYINQFTPTKELPITPARGQTSCFEIEKPQQTELGADTGQPQQLKTVVTGKCYAIPERQNVVVGATFIRNTNNEELSDNDHLENLNGLRQLLPSLCVQAKPTTGFCGIRATTPDRMPVVGPVPDFQAYQADYKLIKNGLPATRFSTAQYRENLFVIGGFGSRGIVSAPYCAKLLADVICSNKVSGNHTLNDKSKTCQRTLTDWAEHLHPGRFAIRALKRNRPLLYSQMQ